MLEQEQKKFVHNRLNSIYKDLRYALESNSEDQQWNLEIENDIVRLLENMKKAYPENEYIKDVKFTQMIPNSLTKNGQTMFLLSQVRKLADAIDFKFELDKAEQTPQNVFNLVQNQSVTQTTVVYDNMISNINQLDLDIKTKQKILELVNEFKEESNKSHPNFTRLLSILEQVGSMSKIAVGMLSYWASVSGILDKIIHHMSSLLK